MVGKRRLGLSLLEVLAVVTIIGVLVAAVVPRISTSGLAAKRKLCAQHRTEINRALERYRMNEGIQLAEVSKLHSAEYFPNGVPLCPVFGNEYSVNALTHRLNGCACQQ